MDKKQIEKIINEVLESESEWYNGDGCMIRAIERRNFNLVCKKATEKILNCI